MADHSKPISTSNYTQVLAELDGRFDDLSLMLDPAFTTATNVITNSIRWTSASNKWQKWNGTAWNDLSANYSFTAITVNSINKLNITSPATSATLTLANGYSLITTGAFSTTLNSTAATNVTLPTTGTLATLAGTETLSNKTLFSPLFSGTLNLPATSFSGAITGNTGIELGGVTGVANSPFIDFHSGATAVDFDTRIIASGGTGASGGGTLTFNGNLVFTTALPVASGGTGVTSSTGTGSNVLSSSPSLSGTPLAPTASVATNSTQIATTAFVTNKLATLGASFRNKLINGAMQINQVGLVSRTTGGYLTDNWKLETTNSFTNLGLASNSLVSLVNPNHIFMQCNTVLATPAAGDFAFTSGHVEGFNITDLRMGRADAKAFTVSFRAIASVADNYSLAIRNADGTRSYVTSIAIGTAVATYTVAIPGDTAGTWLNGTGVGIKASLCFSASTTGTFTTATANTWLAGNFIALNNQANGLSALNRSLSFGDLQLEKGSVATPFEVVDIQVELARCHRYYEAGFIRADGYNTAANKVATMISYKATKRTTPTVTLANIGYANAGGAVVDGGSDNSGFEAYALASVQGAAAFVASWISDARF